MKKKTYKDELIRSMKMLAKKNNILFIGQSVKYSGNAIFNTIKDIPDEKKIELPVFEEVQMGMSLGLAMNGYVPVSIYPRFDFLLLACNQLINHLDKIKKMSENQFQPKVIIRTSVGSKKPLDGGIQHTQDYTNIFKRALCEVEVIYLKDTSSIYETYKHCINSKVKNSFLIIENGDFYNEK